MKTLVSKNAFNLLLADETLDELTLLVRSVIEEELSKDENMDDTLVSECVDFLIAVQSEQDEAFRLFIPVVSCESFISRMEMKKIKKLSKTTRAALYAAIIVSLLFTTNSVVAAISGYNFLESVVEVIQQQFNNDTVYNEDASTVPRQNTAPKKSNETVEPSKPESQTAIIATTQQSAESSNSNAVNELPQAKQTTTENQETVSEKAKENEQKNETVKIVRVVGSAPTKRTYSTNDTVLDIDGLSLRFVYSNGTLSRTFSSADAVIKTLPDFSSAGTQTAVLTIGGIYDYSYDINVYDAKPDSPESRRLLYLEMKTPYTNGYLFYLGDALEDCGIGFFAHYSDGSKEYIDYKEHSDEIKIEGLNLTEETVVPQRLKVTYRGVSTEELYTVRKRRTVIKAAFRYNTHPKIHYYKGEPLGYGVGVDTDTVIPSLASTKSLPRSHWESLLKRYVDSDLVWDVEVRFQYEDTDTQLFAEDLNFEGYNPQQEGYQRIDVYYRGTYILSYYIFVYGDSGLIPSTMPADDLMVGDASTKYSVRNYYTAIGNGIADSNVTVMNASYDIVSDAENLYPGDRKVTTVFPDGTEHRYMKYARISTTLIKNTKQFGEKLIKIPLSKVKALPEELRDYKWRYENSDGESVEIDPEPFFTGITNFEGTPLSESSDISSMFAFVNFDMDRRYFKDGQRITVFCYVYDEGYKNAYTLTVECSSSRYFGEYDLLTADDTEFNYQRNMSYYVSAVDNEWTLSSTQEVNISGVEYGIIGDYTATFTTVFYGEELTAQRPVHIREKIYKPTLKIEYDPNDIIKAFPGDEVSIDGATFVFTDEGGKETLLNADEITYKVNDDGHFIPDEMQKDYYNITYSYLRSNGKYVTLKKSYKMDFSLAGKNIEFFYDQEKNIVFGNWDAVNGADVYEIVLFDETYISSHNSVVCDRNIDLKKSKKISLRCGIIRDGKTLWGPKAYYSTNTFKKKSYEETQEETKALAESDFPSSQEAQILLEKWDVNCIGDVDGENSEFDINNDGVVNAKDYGILLNQINKQPTE